MFIVSSKSGTTLETLSHFEYFWEQTGDGEQFVVVTDPGSALEQLAGDARDARVPRRADDRRPLLGAVALRHRSGCADGHRRRAAARERASGWRRPAAATRTPGCSWASSSARAGGEGRDKVCIDGDRRRLRALGRAADRRVDGQAGQRARAGARREPGRPGPPGRRGASGRRVRDRRRVLPLGVRGRGRRLDPRDQPVRPAGRPGGEGQDEGGARLGRRSEARARGLAGRAARRAPSRRSTSRSRPSSIRCASASSSRSSTARTRPAAS